MGTMATKMSRTFCVFEIAVIRIVNMCDRIWNMK